MPEDSSKADSNNSGPLTLQDIDTAPEKTGSATAQLAPNAYSELLEKFTEVSNENFKLKSDKNELISKINTIETLDGLMKPYAAKAYWFMVGYCVFAGVMLYKSAEHKDNFQVSDSVMKILIGSTAVTVIGLVGMVLTGIFVGARQKA